MIVFLSMAGCRGPAPIEAESIGHPDRDGARIEYFLRRPGGAGPRPTIVFLHGHQPFLSRPGGAAFVRWGVLDRYAAKGYLAVSISLPGYGGSDGPEDFAGPFAQNAVEAVLARLTADGLAARDEVVIEGISLGAVTAALVAARYPRVKGLVLISGLYDLPAFLADPKSAGAAGDRLRRKPADGRRRGRSSIALGPPVRVPDQGLRPDPEWRQGRPHGSRAGPPLCRTDQRATADGRGRISIPNTGTKYR